MEWFPKGRVLFFTVRGEWQCLILQRLDGEIAKAELYAPLLPAILGIPEIRRPLGSIYVMVLNPCSDPLTSMANWRDLESKTRDNCKNRGDSDASVTDRVGRIWIEAPAWRRLVTDHGALELVNWNFPEYRFKKEDNKQLLRGARMAILEQYPALDIFFKHEHEI
jgi:hypothetical protein